MHKKEKVEKIGRILDDLFKDPHVPLKHSDHYTLLIAVLLSAQCTDERVNKTTPVLFKRAQTPFEMVKLSVKEIEEIIRPLGLANSKAKAIHALSEILIKKHEGMVPSTFDELESLPGVGHKTASVVMAQGFHIPAFPVDTHIHRLAKRWGLSDGKSVVKTEKDLKKAFPRDEWIKRHLQIIFFARKFCPARNHDSKKCPICSWIH